VILTKVLITLLGPSIVRNRWSRPSCISPPQLRTSYKESNTIKFETKINLELYLIVCQSLNPLHMPFEIQILNDTKSPSLDKTNIYLGSLSNAWSNPTGNFYNFEVWIHACIDSILCLLWFHVCYNWWCSI
jgi:hypothetical protein